MSVSSRIKDYKEWGAGQRFLVLWSLVLAILGEQVISFGAAGWMVMVVLFPWFFGTEPWATKRLFNPYEPVILVLVFNFLLAHFGFLLFFFDYLSPLQAFGFILPFHQLFVLFGGYWLFKHYLKREPKEVFYVFTKGLAWDRLYSISSTLLAVLPPLFCLLKLQH